MIKSLLIPIIVIIIGLFMLPFFMVYGIPVIAIGVVWLAIAFFYWNSRQKISKSDL